MWNADSVPKVLETEEDIAKRGMVREEFDLAGTVEKDIVV